MRRKYILLEGYDETSIKVPIQKGSYWFTKSHGNKCVIGCNNPQEVLRVSKNGLANLAYCHAHAELNIFRQFLWGLNSNGLWVQCKKSKLVAYSEYGWIIDHLSKITSEKKARARLKHTQIKIKQFNRNTTKQRKRN